MFMRADRSVWDPGRKSWLPRAGRLYLRQTYQILGYFEEFYCYIRVDFSHRLAIIDYQLVHV